MFIDFLEEINEKSEEGSGGRTVKSRKSRVKVYDTIDAALKSGAVYGTIFSTKAADRLYVISKPTWGEKSRSGGNTRIAKGFTPGSATPSASWPSIKAHAVRTGLKHGKSKSKRLTKVYGSGKPKEEEKRYAGKKDKVKEATQSLLAGEESQEEKRKKVRMRISNPSGDRRISAAVKAAKKSPPRIRIKDLSKWNQQRLGRLAASTELTGPFIVEIHTKPKLLGGTQPENLSTEEIAAQNQQAWRRLVASLGAKKKRDREKASN